MANDLDADLESESGVKGLRTEAREKNCPLPPLWLNACRTAIQAVNVYSAARRNPLHNTYYSFQCHQAHSHRTREQYASVSPYFARAELCFNA
jgi:hypothetical protein